MIAIEYGSRHNGVQSFFSDRDLLLIHNESECFTEDVSKYQLLGYDVSVMSEAKANYLSSHGSLFIKHILDEGKTIAGGKECYKNIFTAWKPRPDYQDEIDSNIDILELLNYIPRNKYALLFANDLIITTIRNVSIRKLAGEGEYVFSWEAIFDALYKRGVINSLDMKALLFSRWVKNAYRMRVYYNIDFKFINHLFFLSKKIVGFNGQIGFCDKKSYIIRLPDRLSERSYKQLRAYEIICAFYQFKSDVRKIATFVSRPNYFSNSDIGRNVG